MAMTTRPVVRFLDRTTPPHILTLVLMAGLGAMNMSAFLPSLTHMAEHFDTSYQVMQLSVPLYLAVTAVIQVAIGPISDRYGRRMVTLVSQGIFVFAILGCLVAPNVESFLAFRMLSGAVAVGLVLSRAIVRDMVSQDEAASMIGYVTMGMALVPMVAPMIGGALDEAFGWKAVFWFLLFAGVAIWALCLTDQGETSAGGGVSFRKQVRDYPELLTSPRFWGYVFAAAFASGSFFAFLGAAPYVASEIFGLSSFWSGFCLGAPAIGYALGNYLSGRFSVRYGVNWMVKIGASIASAGLGVAFVLTAIGFDSAFLFFGFCTFVGLGNGMVIPNASAGMLSVRPHLAGTASGLGSAIMIGGGAALSVLSGLVIQGGGGTVELLAIMLTSVVLGLASILYVIRRERAILV
ncbi:DHA1 family bicyclomycin/chloramphenicol resistance-like MFS transporter [Silicimonas algicola]|uniref:Bcr/CflA family efflux transporter n=2 Tax=Silicimonas algicola TaxID=1826607 RepID=A0A316GCA6_9RHOB|nr:DHA1 family bicyclomycin/chloramphenicol resistance-like MFS transporter [Silicimonas algicola]